MIPLTIPDLQKFLTDQQIKVEQQADTNQIYMVYKIADREFPLFFRIFDSGDLLQLIAFIPCNVKPEAAPHLARLLHLLNKELDIPGFGMDEAANVVFYRVMIPSLDKTIDEGIIKRYIHSIESICTNFSPVVATVAFGAATFDDVLKKVKSASETTQKKPK